MHLTLFKRFSAPAVLVTAIWLVLADNGQFWQLISTVAASWDRPNPWFLGSILIVTLTLVNLTLTLLAFGRGTRFVLSALLFASAAAAYFMNQYGVMFDHGMIANMVETDRSEAMELVNSRLLMHTIVFGVLPALLIWRLVPVRQSISGILREKAVVLGLSLLVVATVVTPFYKDYAALVRNHREMRYLLTPTNFLQSIYTYAADRQVSPVVISPISEDVHKGARWAGVKRSTLTVLVVGETARAENFSLGGYARNTNPRLADKEIIYFSNVTSCGTATNVSLPCMFSDLNRVDYSKEKARSRENLLDILGRAGIRTLWLDNNSGCKSVCSQTPFWSPDRSTVSDQCVDGKCFDAVLIDQLKQAIGNIETDTVIVLHQNGSHGPSYYRRYPAEFDIFKPACRSDDFSDCTQEEIVNSYDNTIYYTDYFLSQLIELLDGYSGKYDTAMVYVSDHGESLGEYGLYLHGAPYFLAPDTQTRVPMILWMSSNYQQDFHIDRACLQDRRDDEVTHDHLFHSILGLLNVVTTAQNRELNFLSGCV